MGQKELNAILEAKSTLENNLEELDRHSSLDFSEYTAEENKTLRDAVERQFEKISQCIVDICREILKHEGGHASDKRKEIVRDAVRRGYISDKYVDDLIATVGFRDKLAHIYGGDIDHRKVYNSLTGGFDEYYHFIASVEQYIDDLK